MDVNQTALTANASHIVVNSTTLFVTKTANPATGTATSSYTPYYLSMGLRYTYVTLMIVILIVIIVANITLIALISFYKKLHTTTNVFIANLAFGDIIMAFAVVPFDIDQVLRGYFAFNETICEISSTVFFLSLPASTLNLSILTLERFCAIRFPIMHRTGQIFTLRRKVAILIFSWLYIAITASLPVMGWRTYPTQIYKGECFFHFKVAYALFQLFANFIFPLLFIVAMNISILQIAKKGLGTRLVSRKFSSGTCPILRKSSGANCANANRRAAGMKVSRQSSAASQDANKKATKIIAILVGVFAFCWLPYIINVTVNIICKGCSPRSVTTATMILVFLNSATNPILYGIYKPQIRTSLREVYVKITTPVCDKQKKKKQDSQPTEKEVEVTCV